MQYWWGKMRGWPARSRSTCRGQVEPLAAIAAVLAVCAGLSLYAGVVDDTVLTDSERETADIVLDQAVDATSEVGVVSPNRVDQGETVAPDGWHVNVTIAADGVSRSAGPSPPTEEEATASRRVGVRVEPGSVEPGRIRVVVWR